ncbi:hypothetical protein V2J09_012740 [Rumex salicifolius]
MEIRQLNLKLLPLRPWESPTMLYLQQAEAEVRECRESYAKEILKKFKMENCKPVSTPAKYSTKLSKHEDGEKIDPTLLKSLVGSLRYPTCTGPDILIRYMETPITTHFLAVKRILGYLRAIALAKNPIFHDLTKHIDTRFHYIRECVVRKDVRIKYVKSRNQLADIFTKPLKTDDFTRLRQSLGVIKQV